MEKLVEDFSLTTDEQSDLFGAVHEVDVAAPLAATLAENIPLALAIGTEKARSEMIVVPILIELRRLCDRQISLFSGMDLDVDPERGLNGTCDYLLSRSPEQLFIRAPVVAIVEAKKDDLKAALGQCAAAMVAARIFNERANSTVRTVHGIVTTGSIWRALALDGQLLRIDREEYYIRQVGKILGILRQMVR